jgi:hypothetical protein
MTDVGAPNQVYVFDITCPAGTAIDAPLETDTSFPPGFVTTVDIVIPDGHSGLTGIYLATSRGRAIPINEGSWLSGNNEKLTYNVSDFLDSGFWQAYTYNLDAFDHGWQVRFLVYSTLKAASTSDTTTLAETPLLV